MDILADKYIMELYQRMEDKVIADIARRVKKTGRYTETAELMAKFMHEQGYSTEKIQAEVMKMLRADDKLQMEIAENTKAYKQEIQEIIEKTVKEAEAAGKTLIAEAGNMAWNNDLSMWQQQGVDLKKPNTMSQLIKAFQKQTNDTLRNITGTTGFKNTRLGATGVLNMYQKEMDFALLNVASGTFSFDEAVNECIHQLAQSGLRAIDYASGRTYQLDTAVRMSVRTGMSQLAGKIMEENLKSTGQDLVITSQHMGSRPEHAKWQNRVFSFSGKSKKYESLAEGTGYGTAGGLKGVNCTHDFYPFWEGASVIPEDIEEPEPITIGGKKYTYYQATQQQRKMERNIRALKREIEAQYAVEGETKELRAQLRKQTNDYYNFSKAAKLRPKDNRLRVERGTSVLNKVRDTDKKINIGNIKNISFEKSVAITNLSNDNVECIKNTIAKMSKEYKIKLDSLEIGNYTDSGFISVPVFFRAIDDNGIYKSKLIINNACPFWKNDKLRNKVLNAGYFAGDSIEDFIKHELAHVMTFQECKTTADYLMLEKQLYIQFEHGISDYNEDAKDGAETLAEAFVKVKKGKDVSKKVRLMLKKYIEVNKIC